MRPPKQKQPLVNRRLSSAGNTKDLRLKLFLVLDKEIFTHPALRNLRNDEGNGNDTNE